MPLGVSMTAHRALAIALGQATICFATLRDDLEDEERRLLNAVTDEPGAGRPLAYGASSRT
jgi:hypothetical protein